MKSVLIAIVLFVVFYLGGCMVVGGIAGGKAGANERNSEAAARAGGAAGEKAVRENMGAIAVGAAVASLVGAGLPTLLKQR